MTKTLSREPEVAGGNACVNFFSQPPTKLTPSRAVSIGNSRQHPQGPTPCSGEVLISAPLGIERIFGAVLVLRRF